MVHSHIYFRFFNLQSSHLRFTIYLLHFTETERLTLPHSSESDSERDELGHDDDDVSSGLEFDDLGGL